MRTGLGEIKALEELARLLIIIRTLGGRHIRYRCLDFLRFFRHARAPKTGWAKFMPMRSTRAADFLPYKAMDYLDIAAPLSGIAQRSDAIRSD